MFHTQKNTILSLLKSDKDNRNYVNRYWFSYKDFLDPADSFTAFTCENLDGKQGYIILIENLLNADESAKIYVEVYGFEEDDKESFIYADTLIIYSKLSLAEVKQIFNEPEDIFPSDIGEETDFSRPILLIDDKGEVVPVTEPSLDGYHMYYCWWD